MKKISFHSNQLSLRGTEIALFAYAKYNEEILGNKSLFDNPNSEIPLGSVCVGVIADEKNDCFYWFTYHTAKSLILKYTKAGVSFVFVDTESVLEFTGKIITGINIIDDLLFWTDNLYEPKKINVKLCEEGTDQS